MKSSTNVSWTIHRLINIRYADDILLYAKSLEELQEMTKLLLFQLFKVDLHLHIKKDQYLA